MSIRILLADSQYLVREGLKAILTAQQDLEIVCEVSDVQELKEALLQHSPDVVIMDHDASEFYADEQIDSIADLLDKSRFLIISQELDQKRIRFMLSRGVNAFLTKYCDEEEIVSAIYACVKDEKYLCTKVVNILIEDEKEHAGNCEPTNLTPREIEIVKLVASGLKTKDIAEQLHLSPHTVNTHRKNILKKLDLSSGSELVLYAVRTGLIETETSRP